MDIQIIIFKLMLRKEKFFLVLVYKPFENATEFLNWLSQIIDLFTFIVLHMVNKF